ncbi:MAG: CRISPR-associated ring nuclease [Anaerolineae bacterium]|jgi:CRISPR-associated protein Csx14|nr:CRISPR-associated ring nuclease [Anaerolineae bacterium]MDH7475191.1 CRISPR-associated ring nuclease [Anaerolineae bacterium]
MKGFRSVLLSTMGGQAQVVTFALDALLAQGEEIEQVVVLHLSPEDERVQRALVQLWQEFANDFYAHAHRFCRFRHVVVRDGERPLLDIRQEADAVATWQAVHELMAGLKSQGWRMHLCLAGGRRMIGLLALSVATLIFDHYDRVWHMYTPREFLARARDGAILHAGPDDGVRLIQVPMVPWGAYFPALRALAQATPAQVIAAQTRWLDQAEQARCEAVVEQLTPRQREVLQALAAGCSLQEVAERLCVTVKTVHAHKTVILGVCRNVWELPDDQRLSYYFLREKFGRYFGE